ncbi:MAG: cysteine desulfurase [Aigarchaeota archaeon]|nr:cysteine desulfurase [Aigarchaeota archaeon]
MDVEAVREDFPLLRRRDVIYLDNAATTHKPRQVIDAIREFYERMNANVHRGVYQLAIESTEAYEDARRKVMEFIGARDRREIVFTRNTTESINLVANGYGFKKLTRGSKVVLSEMEHHSNIVPWQILARRLGCKIEYVPITDEGELRYDLMEKMVRDASVVSIVHASNVLGTINNVREIVKLAKDNGAVTVVDAAQTVPHMPVDVGEMGVDFLAFSGHKMLGPMGIGVLYGRRELLEEMDPFLGGGEMIREVTLEGSRWNEVPWKFEAGTPNVADAIGLGAAIDYLKRLGMDKVRDHESKLVRYALERLREIPHLRIYGPNDSYERVGVLSFTLADVHPHDLAEHLDRKFNIAIRAGHHCAMPLHSRLNLTATSRASFYIYNTYEEIDKLVEGLVSALNYYKVI